MRTDPLPEAMKELSTGTPVTSIRVVYPDLHGVARGKDVPIAEFDHVFDHGLRFCAAGMGTDLRHTPVVGGDEGYPDLVARPDMTTMATLPWEPGVASCLADLEPVEGGAPANPYLAIAAVLAAGADGVREGLRPPSPVDGDAYRADRGDRPSPSCIAGRGPRGARPADRRDLLAVKRFEIERHRVWVSDWEITEYLHHL